MPKAEGFSEKWWRREASRATVKFDENLSARGIILQYTSNQEGSIYFVNLLLISTSHMLLCGKEKKGNRDHSTFRATQIQFG